MTEISSQYVEALCS